MKKIIYFCIITLFYDAQALDEYIFDLRPETVLFNAVSYKLEEGHYPEVVEKTIVGRFYKEIKPPVLRSIEGDNDIHMTPFSVLSKMLQYIENGEYGKLSSLYSPKTRDIVSNRLKDSDIRPKLIKWLGSLKEIEILAYWVEPPNLLLAYVRVNKEAGGIRPYVFEFVNHWYLRAGHIDSEFSNYLDAFYTKYTNEDMVIEFPPTTDAIVALLLDIELVSFVERLGINLTEFVVE